MTGKRDFLDVTDFSRAELEELLLLAARMRENRSPSPVLAGRTLGMLFHNPSLRTRTSFEVATYQLGGHCLDISARSDLYELEAVEGAIMDGTADEHVMDAARVLSRYLDGLAVRCLPERHNWEAERSDPLLAAYARHATVPVINMESCLAHPCQAISDLLTIRDRTVDTAGRKITVAWTHAPEAATMAVPASVVTAAALFGMDVTLAHPLGYELPAEVMERAAGLTAEAGGSLRVVNDLEAGLGGAEFVYAKGWGSIRMWEDHERERLMAASHGEWQITETAMARTADAWFMHPLPVRRNLAVADGVLDSPRSIVYDQAENRLHMQKALLVKLLA